MSAPLNHIIKRLDNLWMWQDRPPQSYSQTPYQCMDVAGLCGGVRCHAIVIGAASRLGGLEQTSQTIVNYQGRIAEHQNSTMNLR